MRHLTVSDSERIRVQFNVMPEMQHPYHRCFLEFELFCFLNNLFLSIKKNPMYSPSILTLDSRNRINDDYPNNCQFLMQDTVIVRKIELTNFQFANTLYNVTSYSNKLYIGGVLAATMTAKFWTSASDFITNLNTRRHFMLQLSMWSQLIRVQTSWHGFYQVVLLHLKLQWSAF